MEKRKNHTLLLWLLFAALVLAALALPRLLRPEREAPEHTLRRTESGALGVFLGEQLQEDYTGLVRDGENGRWLYAVNGLVDGSYRGFARNRLGWWYVEDGAVDFERCALTGGEIDGVEGLWYVLGGMVKTDYSGLSAFPPGESQAVIREGRLDESFAGFIKGAGGWWYAKEGRVESGLTDMIEGELDGVAGLWYVRDGRAQLDFRGLASPTGGARWCVSGGRADTELTGIYRDGEEAWFCREGRVDELARCAWTDEEGDWIVTEGRAVPVRTESEKTLFLAMNLAEGIVEEGMSREEKLRACYEAVKRSRECQPRYPHLHSMDWPSIYANDIFSGSGGNCLSFAAAFAYLAKAVGFEEVYCCTSGAHGWAEVEGLIYDPEWTLHEKSVEYYALSYDTNLGHTYGEALTASTWPGYEWMRVKI